MITFERYAPLTHFAIKKVKPVLEGHQSYVGAPYDPASMGNRLFTPWLPFCGVAVRILYNWLIFA